MQDIKQLLPIGTIIRLRKGEKKLMVFGVLQTGDGEHGGKEYDYIGVPYPEGNMGQDYQYLFYHGDVEEVYFRGFEDIQRQEFIHNLKQYCDERK